MGRLIASLGRCLGRLVMAWTLEQVCRVWPGLKDPLRQDGNFSIGVSVGG